MSVIKQDFFQPGERFHGYVVQKQLGCGGTGSVYLVRHELLNALYAIKVLNPSMHASDPTYVKRFLREARIASRIRHPNLVAVHDCGHDGDKDLYYLVMDYVPGSSLRTTLAFEKKTSEAFAANVIAQVAAALDAAQAFHVVHRDIKPENIMVQPDGVVKLVDLGIAKAQNLGDSLRTNTDKVFGTPSYVSPEQAQCAADVDMRADIYSLGIVFFEMLTGTSPYTGRNPAKILAQILSSNPVPDVRDIAPEIRPEVAVLVRRMTMKDRSRRISTFDAVLRELEKLGVEHASKPSPSTEYAEQPVPGMATLINGLGGSTGPKADPLAAPDDDVQEFLKTRSRKRFRATIFRWLLLAAGIAAGIATTILAFSFWSTAD